MPRKLVVSHQRRKRILCQFFLSYLQFDMILLSFAQEKLSKQLLAEVHKSCIHYSSFLSSYSLCTRGWLEGTFLPHILWKSWKFCVLCLQSSHARTNTIIRKAKFSLLVFLTKLRQIFIHSCFICEKFIDLQIPFNKIAQCYRYSFLIKNRNSAKSQVEQLLTQDSGRVKTKISGQDYCCNHFGITW